MQASNEGCKVYNVGGANYLLTDGPDLISSTLKAGAPWELETLELTFRILEGVEAPLVLDIGANLGAFSVPVSKAIAHSGGCVYAFEPQRIVFYQLAGNLFANNLMNCHISHMAIGDHNGSVFVPSINPYESVNMGGLSLDGHIRKQQGWEALTTGEQVPIRRLDDLNLPKVDLLKIDVEGLELEVIRGACRLLAASGFPPIIFEVWGDYMHEQIPKRENLMRFLKDDLGYVVTVNGELGLAQRLK